MSFMPTEVEKDKTSVIFWSTPEVCAVILAYIHECTQLLPAHNLPCYTLKIACIFKVLPSEVHKCHRLCAAWTLFIGGWGRKGPAWLELRKPCFKWQRQIMHNGEGLKISCTGEKTSPVTGSQGPGLCLPKYSRHAWLHTSNAAAPGWLSKPQSQQPPWAVQTLSATNTQYGAVRCTAHKYCTTLHSSSRQLLMAWRPRHH